MHSDVKENNNEIETIVKGEYDESQIQVLEGLDPVRKRPGMYIGSTSERGLHHLVYEIVDNCIDEALAGNCDTVEVTLCKDGSVKVVDNGRGIPVGIHPQQGIPTVEVVHTILHAGGKFGGGAYKVSGGLHGVGASVVNALSEWMEVNVFRDGKIHNIRFERGITVKPLNIVGDTDITGTVTVFKPDKEIFETLEYNYETLLYRFREMAFLNKGVKIIINDNRQNEVVSKTLYYEGGIIQFVQYINNNKDIINDPPIYLEAEKDGSYVEIAIQYNEGFSENIFSYANNIGTTEGGTHLTGFKNAITKVFNDYGRKMNLIKENEKNLSGDDVREGIAAIISVKVHEPQFEGQTKTKLGNSDVRGLVEGALNNKLTAFLEENPSIAHKLIEKCINASRAREAARKARDLTRRKTVFESSSLPGKLADCSEKNSEVCEIYIVEGDSAGGSAKQGRDRKFQAILPLWGKMMNVERQRLDKVYRNEKLLPVIMALGTGIGSDFDLTKLRYGKVIIMADADVDGSHIRTLLLTFFYRHMKPLVENGHVYIAQPPLYKVSGSVGGKKKDFYAYNDLEVDEICDKNEWSKDKIAMQRYKGLGEMNPDQLWDTTMNPETRIMLRVTSEDAMMADEIFSTLMGEKVEPRKEFIQKNAKYAGNIDV